MVRDLSTRSPDDSDVGFQSCTHSLTFFSRFELLTLAFSIPQLPVHSLKLSLSLSLIPITFTRLERNPGLVCYPLKGDPQIPLEIRLEMTHASTIGRVIPLANNEKEKLFEVESLVGWHVPEAPGYLQQVLHLVILVCLGARSGKGVWCARERDTTVHMCLGHLGTFSLFHLSSH